MSGAGMAALPAGAEVLTPENAGKLIYYTLLLFGSLIYTMGSWKLFKKCGGKGWWSLIPGYRLYKLGVFAGRELDARVHCILDVLIILLRGFWSLNGQASQTDNVLMVVLIALDLAELVYQVRISSGLCEVFRASRAWIFLWLFADWIPAVVWGFGKRYQPHEPESIGREEMDLPTWADEDPGVDSSDGNDLPGNGLICRDAYLQDLKGADTGSGLCVRLKERTAGSRLKKKTLLKDIRLTIPNGSLVLLLGGSGAGKTTFVNAVTGYETADAEMLLNGRNIYRSYEELKHRIGFVPQQELMRENDTVVRTLSDAARMRLPVTVGFRERRERIKNVMETLGLTAGLTDLVSKKSGGQKKRISIGMELITDPDLFILDEPDSGLDGVIARELFERLRAIADQGKIVIAITHTPDRVVDLFDRVIVLAKDESGSGRLAFYGSPDDAKRFFGKNSMEKIVMTVNGRKEGGEGRADEMVQRFESLRKEAAAYAAKCEPAAV